MKTPVHEFLESKTAGFSDAVRSGVKRMPSMMGEAATGAVAGALASAGAAGIGVAVQKIMESITKARDFRQMLEHNPDLSDKLKEDPKFFNQAYSSLRKANPHFAGDPLIAGTYMRQMTDAPQTAGGRIEVALQGAMHAPSPIMGAFHSGALEGAKRPMRSVAPMREASNQPGPPGGDGQF